MRLRRVDDLVYSNSMDTSAKLDQTPWSIGRLLQWTTEHFTRREVDEPRLCAEILLAHASGKQRIELYARFNEVPPRDVLDKFRDLVKRAANHEPVAYLVEEKEFYSLKFRVTKAVLIPRPETETLIEVVVDHCQARELSSPLLLDMGTGSGCIAITLLKQLPNALAFATDVSEEVLAIARENTEQHKLTDRLTLLKADRLAIDSTLLPERKFDLIASNPPYIAEHDVSSLDANVRDHEPLQALSDGEDGFSFYRTLALDAMDLLALGGAVFVEIADTPDNAAQAVEAIFAGHGWSVRARVKDRTVGKTRVLGFTRSKE